MRNVTKAVMLIALCSCISISRAIASPDAVTATSATRHHLTYYNRGHGGRHFNNRHDYPRSYYAPRRGHRSYYRPHHRYLDWHGFRTPSWHYPRSFRYHRYGH
jgi:hypothetical protein